MADFAPSDFYLAHPTITASPQQIERWEKERAFTKTLAEWIKETSGTKTIPVDVILKEDQLQVQTRAQTLEKQVAEQIPKEEKALTYGAFLLLPVAVSLVAPKFGIPMLIGEISAIGTTGLVDVFEDVLKQRPIKIDYPAETYVASGIGGQVAGSVGAVISPFATSGLAQFGAGGLIATSGLFVKDITEELLMGEPIQFESPLTYGTAFLIGGGAYYLGSKAAEKIKKLSEEGKITLIKPGIVKEGEETWMGLYKEKAAEAKPLFGLKIRSLGEGEYEITAGRELRFTTYSPLTKAGEINLPKSPIETYLKLPAMKEFYQKMAEGGLTPEQLEIAREFLSKVYTQQTPYPVSSLKEIIQSLDRAKGFEDDLYGVLKDFLKKQDIMVYGSATQKMYGALSREIHDLDIQALKPRVAENLVSKLQSQLGNKIIVQAKPDGSGYEILNKAGEKVMEIFKYGVGYSPYSKWLGYGFYQKTPFKTEEGLFMRLEEQAARKFVSSFTPQETMLFPLEHRIKDVGDLVSVMNYYAQKNPDLKPLFEEFLRSGNKEVMNRILSQIPEKISFAFSISSSAPQSSIPIYTSIFASSSGLVSYSTPSPPPSKPSEKSSKPSDTASQPLAPSAPSMPSISAPVSIPSPAPSISISYPSFPSSPSYSSPSYSFPSYSPYIPASSPSSKSTTPPSLPSLPLLFPRDIDLNKKIEKLLYRSMWRSELSYV